MKVALLYLAVGLVLLWVGWNHWRYRKQETINAIEAAILKGTGEDPLPLTKLDWFLKYLQAILGFALGCFFTLLGGALLLHEIGVI